MNDHEVSVRLEPSPIVSFDDPGIGGNPGTGGTGFLLLADGESFLTQPDGFRILIP